MSKLKDYSDSIPTARDLIADWSQWVREHESRGVETRTYGYLDDLPLQAIHIKGGAVTEQRPTLYISAGVHGDEPAGALALLSWIQRTDLANLAGDWWIIPLANPTGWDLGKRETLEGYDLNRDFGSPRSKEVQHQQRFLQLLPAPDLFLSLHEDYEGEGFYLYALGDDALASQILHSVSHVMPLQKGPAIDGKPVENGLILMDQLHEELSGATALPEAIWFHQRNLNGVNLTSETPSTVSLSNRIEAHRVVLDQVAAWRPRPT